MPPFIKPDPDSADDQKWNLLPGVGTVPSGPRASEYWQGKSHQREITDVYERKPHGDLHARENERDYETDHERHQGGGRGYDSYRPDGDGNRRRDRSPERSRSSHYRKCAAAQDSATSQDCKSGQHSSSDSGYQGRPSSDQSLGDAAAYSNSHRSTFSSPAGSGPSSNSNFDNLNNNLANLFRLRMNPNHEPFAYSSGEYASRPKDYRHSGTAAVVKQEAKEETPLFYPERRRRRSSTSFITSRSSKRSSSGITGTRHSTTTDPSTDTDSEASPPPSPPYPCQQDPQPPHNCTCPIDLLCGVKQPHLIDCRPLVPEWERWQAPTGFDPNE
jgi:hypothetical protein